MNNSEELKIGKLKYLEVSKLVITVVFLLFTFLVGVSALSGGVKLMGADFAKTLFDLTGQPLVSLMAGMLATVLFQSSSVTTSIIVGLVSAGTISIGGAVPMIMGANLGTSVTNTFVSLAYIKDAGNFKKAFAAATVHDFFNILSVLVLLPLEMMTGFIEKSANALSGLMYGSISGLKYKSPIKAAIKPVVGWIKGISIDTFGTEVASFVMILLAGVIIISSLSLIVKNMKHVFESNKGEIVNKILSKNGYASILFGAGLTVAVQSSSITTSLLIPMAGTGFLTLEAIYPITIGANIGTTATALIAALTGNVAGLSIALVHLIFNLLGFVLFFPHPGLRTLPMKCAEKLASSIEKTKLIGFGYIGTVFFALPISMIYLSR